MNFYVIGEDKSLVDVTTLVLALAGGAMKGNIRYDSGATVVAFAIFLIFPQIRVF